MFSAKVCLQADVCHVFFRHMSEEELVPETSYDGTGIYENMILFVDSILTFNKPLCTVYIVPTFSTASITKYKKKFFEVRSFFLTQHTMKNRQVAVNLEALEPHLLSTFHIWLKPTRIRQEMTEKQLLKYLSKCLFRLLCWAFNESDILQINYIYLWIHHVKILLVSSNLKSLNRRTERLQYQSLRTKTGRTLLISKQLELTYFMCKSNYPLNNVSAAAAVCWGALTAAASNKTHHHGNREEPETSAEPEAQEALLCSSDCCTH